MSQGPPTRRSKHTSAEILPQPSASRSPLPTPHSRTLLLAFLAGPLIWSIYHLAGYILGEFGCRARFLTGRIIGFPLLSLVIIGLAVVALLVTLYAAYWSYQQWRPMRDEPGWIDERGRFSEGRTQFLLFSAMLLNTLFAGIILMAGISLLLLDPCQWI